MTTSTPSDSALASYLEQLGRAHGFTLAELDANRRGEIHARQMARGTRKGRVSVMVQALFGFLALGGGLVGAYLVREELGPKPSDLNAVYAVGGVGVLVSLVFLYWAALSFSLRRARKAAFRSGRIVVCEGPLDKVYIEGRGLPSQNIFRVGGSSFHTSSALWELLTQGANYRLYLVFDQLLSFEPRPAERGTSAGQMATRAVGVVHDVS